VVGVPVYFHYCGDELAKIDYVMKGGGCCDDEDDAQDENSCCHDESKFLLNTQDFTIKNSVHALSFRPLVQEFNSVAPVTLNTDCGHAVVSRYFKHESPPLIMRIIAITVLRI